ncbi:hypothetical protein LTR08_000189 [Meristemomyces frigidus]|nr:hypothetical protein LTR08_000189 [Meristemomyces frigidus]
MSPMPTDLPLKHDSMQHLREVGKSKVKGTCSAGPTEGVFLDFLYPPQTLAWMHRATSQGWERWERRNAKRLPEGFIQTTRGYTSRARKPASIRQKLNAQGPKLELDTVAELLSLHAKDGQLASYGEWDAHLKKYYPTYEDQKGLLWSSIYVHARRADLLNAKKAFEKASKLTAEHDEIPPLQCWNVLLHAYSRDDDLEGGLETLQAVVDKGLKPDRYTFHPLMEMFAKRGDVDGVKDLLIQYDTIAQKGRRTESFGSLLTALVNSGEMDEAEATLKTTIDQVKKNEVGGSLTGCFNIVLTGYALRRDVDATTRIYRWMKAEGVHLDADTFAALIQALTAYRQTQAAWKILRVVMPDHDIGPTAFHYALVMTGFTNVGKYDDALLVHKHMNKLKIQSTPSLQAAYLKAKALQEHRRSGNAVPRALEAAPLTETLDELQRVLRMSQGSGLAAKQPYTGLGEQDNHVGATASYFNFLIFIHGKRRCFDAVRALYKQFKGSIKHADPPIKLLGALMAAHLREQNYEEVERCWLLAKEQADGFAPTLRVPQFEAEKAVLQVRTDIMDLHPAPSDKADKANIQTSDRDSGEGSAALDTTKYPQQAKQAITTDTSVAPKLPKPSPGLNHILTRPTRFYLYALAKQQRMRDMLTVVSKLFNQGYTMDNRTWNVFIQLLCQCSPPLVLLAYTLTERFLMPQFPGWAPITQKFVPNPGAIQNDLQYLRARYLRPGLLMPHYKTLVILGAGLLQLRSIEATGRRGGLRQDRRKRMDRYVGSLKQVRQQAPATLFAVQNMPRINEAFQSRYLRR